MKRRNDSGFTMIELLIVMVLIGVMVTMAVPRMDFIFSKNDLRTSTSSVTSTLYMARMKAVNSGELYGVQFTDTGEFYLVEDPQGSPQVFGAPSKLEDGIEFTDITFTDWLAVFNEYGQLDKNCLPAGTLTGTIGLTNDAGDSTQVEVTFITGRIRETSL